MDKIKRKSRKSYLLYSFCGYVLDFAVRRGIFYPVGNVIRKKNEIMKISTKGRYGLRVLIDLATHDPGKPRMLKDIAQSQQISDKYISRLVIDLRRAKLRRTDAARYRAVDLRAVGMMPDVGQRLRPPSCRLSSTDSRRRCGSCRRRSPPRACVLKLFCASAECADRKLDVPETKIDAPNESSAEKTIRH